MAVYLLHFERPISATHTTQHYIGYARELSDRILAHVENRSGARLVEVAHQRDLTFTIARVWQGDRKLERHLKSLKNAPKFCPYCARNPWQLFPPQSIKPARELTGNQLKEQLLFA